MKLAKDRLLELVAFVEPGSDDVTYTHAVFAQCFLPIRRLPHGGKRYEVRHGRAALLITAGDLLNPETQQFVQMDVPSGSAARIALAHINNHIIRSRSLHEALTVPMGDSLRDFMDYQGLAIGGKNGKEITRQIHNLAAAHIMLGVWTYDRARQINAQIADAIDFWLERDRRQRTLWQPVMRVSERYAEAIREHCVPHDMRALVGLYENTRAMDIYTWLAYRLPRVKERTEVFVRFDDLKPIFGTGIRDRYKFRQAFKLALTEALRWYPVGRMGIEKEGIRLFNSPSPVPIDLERSPYGRTIAGGRRRLTLVEK
jgi:Plasmid encoded RepA protein